MKTNGYLEERKLSKKLIKNDECEKLLEDILRLI